jgi:SAM-dependent methyltransferase
MPTRPACRPSRIRLGGRRRPGPELPLLPGQRDPPDRGRADVGAAGPRTAARQAGTQIEIVPGAAEDIPGQDGDYDAVVACLTPCSVPDQRVALSEIRRVLRSGGQLRYFEHVLSDQPALARLERLLDG